MDSVSTSIDGYVNEISAIGGELGPMVVEGMILLLIVLVLVKFLGQSLAKLLIKVGIPERRAALSVTGLHIIVLLIGALLVLSMVGFPGVLLFRVIMIVIMGVVAIYIIGKPYVPTLPFQTGDIIDTASGMGIVDQISVMHTRIRTFEGKMIYIPNHKVFNGAVTNSSVRPNRRLDIDFFIPYGQDIKKVKDSVGEILKQDEIVLEKPAPRVVIDKFKLDYLAMKARFWVLRKHALTGRWGLNEKIMSSFEKEGIAMASPRLEVSLPNQSR
jgi:small conductance mechanosensitive channel